MGHFLRIPWAYTIVQTFNFQNCHGFSISCFLICFFKENICYFDRKRKFTMNYSYFIIRLVTNSLLFAVFPKLRDKFAGYPQKISFAKNLLAVWNVWWKKVIQNILQSAARQNSLEFLICWMKLEIVKIDWTFWRVIIFFLSII